jgi:uncharacterized coiled-coil DUF342 family protein
MLCFVQNATVNAEVAKLKASNKALMHTIAELENDLNASRIDSTELRQDLTIVRMDRDRIQRELDTARQTNFELRAAISRLEDIRISSAASCND